jgi:hypothetical protein
VRRTEQQLYPSFRCLMPKNSDVMVDSHQI